IQADPAEPPPGDRVADLRAQALIAQPVPELQEPQRGNTRPAQPVGLAPGGDTARSTPGHPAARPPVPAPPAAAATLAAAAPPTTTADCWPPIVRNTMASIP